MLVVAHLGELQEKVPLKECLLQVQRRRCGREIGSHETFYCMCFFMFVTLFVCEQKKHEDLFRNLK